jgi:hypothetical protein
MASIQKTSTRFTVLVASVLLWAGASVAQAPDQTPDRQKLRQPTPQSVQQQEDAKGAVDTKMTEADRKVQEMDRRLKRTLRSICNGC